MSVSDERAEKLKRRASGTPFPPPPIPPLLLYETLVQPAAQLLPQASPP